MSFCILLQVVLFFETVPDGSDVLDASNGSAGPVSHSVTFDSIHSPKPDFTGRYAQTHRYTNIQNVKVPTSISTDKKSDQLGDSFSKSSNNGRFVNSVRGGAHTMNYADHTAVAEDNVHGRLPPPTSQSVPDQLSLRQGQSGNYKSNRQAYFDDNKPANLLQVGDRRAQTLLPVESDSSLDKLESVSVGEPEDNFSDTDTDDEWEGCEVTVV